jgi:8-oxo-dGTP pyrophosphatase MutT (NUDIX family)
MGGMRREHSAGGVVVRRFSGVWQFVAIRPLGRSDVWALPKGHIDGRESEQETAVREVREETGMRTALDQLLGEVSYWFRADGDRIFKKVTFYLLRWQSGSPMPQNTEVEEVAWFDLELAHDILTYPGERDIALKAAEVLAERR